MIYIVRQVWDFITKDFNISWNAIKIFKRDNRCGIFQHRTLNCTLIQSLIPSNQLIEKSYIFASIYVKGTPNFNGLLNSWINNTICWYSRITSIRCIHITISNICGPYYIVGKELPHFRCGSGFGRYVVVLKTLWLKALQVWHITKPQMDQIRKENTL